MFDLNLHLYLFTFEYTNHMFIVKIFDSYFLYKILIYNII